MKSQSRKNHRFKRPLRLKHFPALITGKCFFRALCQPTIAEICPFQHKKFCFVKFIVALWADVWYTLLVRILEVSIMRGKNSVIEDVPCDYCYDKLWKLLIDRRMKKKDLRQLTHISPAVIAKMGRREAVNLETLAKICIALKCKLSDLVDIVPRGKPELC